MKIAYSTLGCKVNQYETQILRQSFESRGFETVPSTEIADVYIVNSCTVTSTGDKKTRQLIRHLRHQNPDAIIALTGCFPQAFPEEAAAIREVDIITGTKDRASLVDLICDRVSESNIGTDISNRKTVVNIPSNMTDRSFEKMQLDKFTGKTRAFVKIQDGCDRFCSYCIIPMSRGRVRSKSIEDIITEVSHLANSGHKEIVLIGINLPSYGKDIGLKLIDAIEAVCNVEGIKRVRLGSLEPELLTLEDIKKLSKLDKFCPQFHLCLQSGCDQTLARMNRHYTTSEYLEIVNIIRENIDNPSITTDLMVGFPGETDEELESTIRFIKRVGFSRMHIFAYSKRAGTKAATMPNQIPNSQKKIKSSIVIKIAEQMYKEFLETQVGLIQEVLFETTVKDDTYYGYSKNYTHVMLKSKKNIAGQIKKVKIVGIEDDLCIAEMLDE